MSWEDLEPGNAPEEKKRQEQIHQERYDRSVLFNRIFGSEEGQKVLAYLKDIYVTNCRWNPNLEVLNSIRWGFIREGQAMVIQHIEDEMAYSKKGE